MSGTRAQRPRHPKCGITWLQRGDLTGHCSMCCRTFSSVSGFDQHHRITDGVLACLDPASMLRADGSPRFTAFQDEAGATVWRRADRTPNPFTEGDGEIPAPRSATSEHGPDPEMAGGRVGVRG